MWNKEDIKAIITLIIVGVAMAAIRALMTKGESAMQRVRTFFAGCLMTVVCALVVNSTSLSDFYKYLITGVLSAFISTIWPILEKYTAKWVSNRGKDLSK
jgi:uncharacterized membrane protein